jgi:RecB family endonuclease NucS
MAYQSAIDALLAQARAVLDRVKPGRLDDELAAGAVLIDIRPVDQRQRDGELTGAKPSLPTAKYWAVEVKRVAGLDAVEQLTRYVELLNRDPLLAPVGGILAAQTIKPQARTLAEDRGLRCVALDYDALRGMDPTTPRLF